MLLLDCHKNYHSQILLNSKSDVVGYNVIGDTIGGFVILRFPRSGKLF